MKPEIYCSYLVPEKQVQFRCLLKEVGRKVQAYYRDPEHRRQFSDWYREKYGEEYDWNKMRISNKN